MLLNKISTVLCQKALSAIFTFLQERQKTDYNQLLVTLMFGKITKYSALVLTPRVLSSSYYICTRQSHLTGRIMQR